MACVLAFNFAAILFVSRYFNYGAEGIEIASLLRMSAGLPYVTPLPEIPWFVNQYSPYFYVIVDAPIRVLGLRSLSATALCARLSILVFVVVLLVSAYHHFRRSQHFSRNGYLLASLWFLLLFPANIVCVRPDFPSFFLEFLGFIVWRRKQDSEPHSLQGPLIAGLLLGSALALKLNTIGVVTGLVLYEVVERRWLRALVLTSVTAAAAGAYLALGWKIWGASALHDTFLALQSQVDTPSELANRLAMLLFYAAPLVALAGLGFRRLLSTSASSPRALLFVVVASFVLATAQQIKTGAWYNYYYGAFVLILGPAAVGIDILVGATRRQNAPLIAMLGFGLLHATWSARVPLAICRDYMRDRYPFAAAIAWCERSLPRGAIYSEDPNALLHFQPRVLLGSNAEIVLGVTPALRPFAPALLNNMRPIPYVAAIATGPSCADWRPRGFFHDAIAHLTRLTAQFGWICVFAPRIDQNSPPDPRHSIRGTSPEPTSEPPGNASP